MKDKSITRFLGDIKPIKNYERYYVSKLGHVFTIGRTSQLKEIAPCKTPKRLSEGMALQERKAQDVLYTSFGSSGFLGESRSVSNGES